jgi:hypothetical protein
MLLIRAIGSAGGSASYTAQSRDGEVGADLDQEQATGPEGELSQEGGDTFAEGAADYYTANGGEAEAAFEDALTGEGDLSIERGEQTSEAELGLGTQGDLRV